MCTLDGSHCCIVLACSTNKCMNVFVQVSVTRDSRISRHGDTLMLQSRRHYALFAAMLKRTHPCRKEKCYAIIQPNAM